MKDVMKSLSDLVNDSEDYSGEPMKAISISVTEIFTVLSSNKRMAIFRV